jgi:hypothetical protein
VAYLKSRNRRKKYPTYQELSCVNSGVDWMSTSSRGCSNLFIWEFVMLETWCIFRSHLVPKHFVRFFQKPGYCNFSVGFWFWFIELEINFLVLYFTVLWYIILLFFQCNGYFLLSFSHSSLDFCLWACVLFVFICKANLTWSKLMAYASLNFDYYSYQNWGKLMRKDDIRMSLKEFLLD